MRDNKSGVLLNTSLFCTLLLTAVAAVHLFAQHGSAMVNYAMIPIGVVGMLLTYLKGTKPGVLWTGVLFALLAILTLILLPEQGIALLYWLVWSPLALVSVHNLRTGVNGLVAERDYYRKECARVAMIDPITQMRNMHAFLNDAPIYIKIANRYKLTMVVLAIKVKNAPSLHKELGEDIYREMLEGVSAAIHKTIRLEDLAYLVDNETGVWCINMFTHLEAIDTVIGRMRKNLSAVGPKHESDEPYRMEFSFGYATYDAEEDPTPATLLRRAQDMAEGK